MNYLTERTSWLTNSISNSWEQLTETTASNALHATANTAYWLFGLNNITAAVKELKSERDTIEDDNAWNRMRQIGTEMLHFGVKWGTLVGYGSKSWKWLAGEKLVDCKQTTDVFSCIINAVPPVLASNCTQTASFPFDTYSCQLNDKPLNITDYSLFPKLREDAENVVDILSNYSPLGLITNNLLSTATTLGALGVTTAAATYSLSKLGEIADTISKGDWNYAPSVGHNTKEIGKRAVEILSVVLPIWEGYRWFDTAGAAAAGVLAFMFAGKEIKVLGYGLSTLHSYALFGPTGPALAGGASLYVGGDEKVAALGKTILACALPVSGYQLLGPWGAAAGLGAAVTLEGEGKTRNLGLSLLALTIGIKAATGYWG